MTRLSRLWLYGGLGLIAILLAVFASRFGVPIEQGFSPVVGSSVPDVSLPALEGGSSVDLAELDQTNDIVVINFFASWCLQCRNEHSDLVATADAYADRSVQFVGVAFQDRTEQAIGFLDELGRGESSLYVEDPGSRAAIELGVFGVPETIFIADGVVIGKLLGETDALTLSATIEQILAGDAIETRQVGDHQQP